MLGEGAGVLVLESEEHAQARGAKIYAEVLGAGITADAHDIAQPDPAGRGGARAIVRALEESGIQRLRHRRTSTRTRRPRRRETSPRA